MKGLRRPWRWCSRRSGPRLSRLSSTRQTILSLTPSRRAAPGHDKLHFDRCTPPVFSRCARFAPLRLCAVLISAICVSACGKFPVWRRGFAVVLLGEEAKIVGDRRPRGRTTPAPGRIRRPAHGRPPATACRRGTRLRPVAALASRGSCRSTKPSASGDFRRPRACPAPADRPAAESPPRQQQDAGVQRLRSVGFDESSRVGVKAVFADVAMYVSRKTRHFTSGALKPNVSTLLMPRSNATHVITLENT